MGDFFYYLRGFFWLVAMLALLGMYLAIRTGPYEAGVYTETTAVITDIDTDATQSSYPTFKFSDENGTHSIRSSRGFPPKTYHVGQRVTIQYPYLQPNDAAIKTWREWIPTLLLATLAGVSALIAMTLHFLENRADKREDAKRAAARAARLANDKGTPGLTP